MPEEQIIKPLYQQIAIDIANRIANGEFAVGSKIHGRSTLASQYNVSPETIRRAIILLEDVFIVEVYQGSGIVVKSRNDAYKFIEKFKNIDSLNYIKKDILTIIQNKRKMNEDLELKINKLIDFSERFKNTNPFSPIEIGIGNSCKLLEKTIAEVNFWQNTGATIIAIRREGQIILSPGPYALFTEGDIFIFIGDENAYERIIGYLNN
ncbi:MAG: GntR family transcriptional regulator [Firmicutes bacterium HGW-Firmicutes-1]|jgi:K+/H+ antiporter YhaU regulatory subunit KhtT|nr:MAG: GntR family transcriptional regulator [Firmicutes bacterium HGW-Firmicutes-1]